MKSVNRQKKQRGFTLIEVMVVVVILGILAAVVVPRLMDRPDAARITKAQADIQTLKNALSLYRLDNHKYPSTDQGLQALVEKPEGSGAWKQGGYIDKLPKDPWGNDYQYVSDGSEIEVFSYGADGGEGGDGVNADISSKDI